MASLVHLSSSSGENERVLGNSSMSLPWVEKYRPQTLQDMIAHDDIIQIRKFWMPTAQVEFDSWFCALFSEQIN